VAPDPRLSQKLPYNKRKIFWWRNTGIDLLSFLTKVNGNLFDFDSVSRKKKENFATFDKVPV